MRTRPTLGITNAGDSYEQEADRVAEEVMTRPRCSALSRSRLSIQPFSGQRNDRMYATPASVDEALTSPSTPLEPRLRQDMEERFDHNFSQVRLHSGPVAERSAKDMNALAYTVGSHLVFGAGRYAPGSAPGRTLLAHELAHVVQQSGSAHGTVIQRAPDGPLPVVIVSGPSAQPNVAEDEAEKNIRTSGAKAEKAGAYRFVQTTGYADYQANAHKVLKDNECCSKALINGHGGSDDKSAWMTMGSATDPKRGWGTTDIGNNAGTLIGDDVFKNVKFCKPCEVWLGGCDFAANKPGLLFMQKVANATGCTAKAYATEVTTNPDTGWVESISGTGKKKKKPSTP